MDLVISLLVVPFETLEEAKHHSILIVVAWRQLIVFDLKKVSKVCQMSFFTLTKVLSLEEKTLVIATWYDKEYVLK